MVMNRVTDVTDLVWCLHLNTEKYVHNNKQRCIPFTALKYFFCYDFLETFGSSKSKIKATAKQKIRNKKCT